MRHYTFPKSFISRLADTARASGTYTWTQEVEEYLPSGWIRSNGRRLLMLAGYSYLGLIRNKRWSKALSPHWTASVPARTGPGPIVGRFRCTPSWSG